MNSTGCVECSISRHQSHWCICLKGNREKSNHTRKEQEEIGTGSRGNQRTVNMDRQCQEVAMKGSWLALSLMKKTVKYQRWKKTKSRNEMQKPATVLRCSLLNGSAWYMRRYQGTFGIFFGIEHRTRKKEMEEFNKETEDRKQTSGGFFVAIDSYLGAVVDKQEGAVTSIPRNDRRIGQAWVNVRGGMRVFAVYSGFEKAGR